MGTRPARVLGLPIAVAALLAAGCGSSAKQTTFSKAGASARSAFVANAQRICAKLSAEEAPLRARQEANRGLTTPAAEKSFVSIVRQVAAISHTAESKLQALPRPAGDAAKIAALLGVFGGEIADVENLATAAANQEGTVGEDAETEIKRAVTSSSREAHTFGIARCTGSE